MVLLKNCSSKLIGNAATLLLILLLSTSFLSAQVVGPNEHLTMVVEFDYTQQRIYITQQNQKPQKIAVLSPLKEANNIARNVRIKEEASYKEKGYSIKRKKLNSVYDFTMVFEFINQYEAEGWNLDAQNISTGGAELHNDYVGKAIALYAFSRPKQ